MAASLLDHLLEYHEYRQIKEIHSLTGQGQQVLDLAEAALYGDTTLMEELIDSLGLDHLKEPDPLKLRAYCAFRHLDMQMKRQEYGDFFRAMTPIMVDLLRLISKRLIIPQLDEFMETIYKESEEGKLIYRGLQWKEDRVDASDNIIHQTFKKYYGNNFRYDQYVSSSHLTKILSDHCQDLEIVQRAETLRFVEKYVRNISAHECVYINDSWVQDRVGLSINQIWTLLQDLGRDAGLTNQAQIHLLESLNQELKTNIQE